MIWINLVFILFCIQVFSFAFVFALIIIESSVEEEMRVCLSSFRPHIRSICHSHQAQVCH